MNEQMNNEQQVAFTTQSESFASFLRLTDQKIRTQQAIIGTLKSDFSSVWTHVENPDYEMNIFYAGVGNGGVEIDLTKRFVNERGGAKDNIRVYCEDPSVYMRKQFYSVAEQSDLLPMIQDYSLQRLEEYHPPQADFILVSHVMYYVEDWDMVLSKLALAVKERYGVVLLVLQSDKSDNFRIRARCSPLMHAGTRERCGEEITVTLDRLGIKYLSYIVDAHTDVRPCFQNGQFNPTLEGKRLLTFILRTPWDTLNDEMKRDFAQHLSSIVEDNHEQTMIFRDMYIWVYS